MKTIFKILLVIGFFTISFQNAKAADTLNPCWRLYYPHDPEHHSFNPDSVMLDTCATTNPIEPVLYAYQWYLVILPPGALYVPEAPRDSIILRNWRDIDTNFTELRNGFQMIEEKFSPFIMRKEHPHITDTTSLGSRSFLVKYENYFIIDTLIFYLSSIQNLTFTGYDMRAARWEEDDVNDKNSDENQNIINVYPNPAKDLIKIDFQEQFNKEKIQIISLEGIIILESEYKELIDISNLSTGVYFIKYGDIVRSFIVYHY